MKRLALFSVALAIALIGVPPASGRPPPVEGGGSFLDATSLSEGRYSDTILPEETSYYSVYVAPGQRLVVVARGLPLQVDLKRLFPGYLNLALHGPDRSERSFELDAWIPDVPSERLVVRSRVIGRSEWPAGEYFFTVTLGDHAKSLRAREYPLRLSVSLKGTARPTPTSSQSVVTALPTPSETVPVPDPAPVPEEPGPPLRWFVGAFVVGGTLGAVGRLLLVRRT